MKLTSLKLIFFILTSFYITQLSAQTNVGNANRIEFELEDAENHKIIPVDKDGIYVIYKTDTRPGKGMKELIAERYDADLKKQQNISLSIKKNYVMIAYEKTATDIYLLYANDENGYGNTMLSAPYFKEYTVIKLNINTNEFITYDGTFPKTFHYKNIKVLDGAIYLAGSIGPSVSELSTVVCLSACLCYIPLIFYNPKYTPFIVSIDMRSSDVSKKDYPMNNYGKTTANLIDLDVNEETKKCDLMIKTKTKKEVKLLIKDIADDKLGKDTYLKIATDKEIFSGHINTFGDKKIIGGIYGAKTGMKKGTQTNSQGIMVSMFDGGKSVFTNLIPYSKFKNFKFVQSNREEKIAAKNSKKGVETTISMSVLFHDVLLREDEIVYMGEAYYPSFHVEITYSVDAQGRTTTSRRTVFDGYKFFGIVTFGVDFKGNLLWENGTHINGPLSFFLNYKFKFIEQEDESIRVLYSDAESVKSVKISKNESPVFGKSISIKTYVEGDKKPKGKNNKSPQAPSGSAANIEYWFDNNFIAFGEQVIKNNAKDAKSKGVKKKRQVFFLNKIEIDLD